MRPTIWLTVALLIGLASGAWPSQLRADEQTDTCRPALQPVSFRPLSAADGQLSLHIRGSSSDRQGQGAALGRLEDRQRDGRSAAVEPGEKRSPLEELTLIPYGCTDPRITEFPTLAPR